MLNILWVKNYLNIEINIKPILLKKENKLTNFIK